MITLDEAQRMYQVALEYRRSSAQDRSLTYDEREALDLEVERAHDELKFLWSIYLPPARA